MNSTATTGWKIHDGVKVRFHMTQRGDQDPFLVAVGSRERGQWSWRQCQSSEPHCEGAPSIPSQSWWGVDGAWWVHTPDKFDTKRKGEADTFFPGPQLWRVEVKEVSGKMDWGQVTASRHLTWFSVNSREVLNLQGGTGRMSECRENWNDLCL